MIIIVIIYVIIYLISMYKLNKRADKYSDHFKPKD